jgi:hypothetical protein
MHGWFGQKPMEDRFNAVHIIREISLKGAGDEAMTITLEASNSVDIESKMLITGHFKDELWGLAVRPAGDAQGQGLFDDEYCTVSACC